MINMLIILLILSFSGIFLFVVYMNHLDKRIYELDKKIDKLEKKIYSIQYQIDDALRDINIVNKNILNTYGMLSEMKQNQNEND